MFTNMKISTKIELFANIKYNFLQIKCIIPHQKIKMDLLHVLCLVDSK
jgi:hypothetical protein